MQFLTIMTIMTIYDSDRLKEMWCKMIIIFVLIIEHMPQRLFQTTSV